MKLPLALAAAALVLVPGSGGASAGLEHAPHQLGVVQAAGTGRVGHQPGERRVEPAQAGAQAAGQEGFELASQEGFELYHRHADDGTSGW